MIFEVSARARFRAFVAMSGLWGLSMLVLTGCPPTMLPSGNTNTSANTNANANVNVNMNVSGNENGNQNENDNTSGVLRAFVGAATCFACHNDEHTDWTATAHAGALETLRAIGQQANAACLPCHTVGFGATDGFVDESSTPQLAGVQCENCHGAAGDHARNPADVSVRPAINFDSNQCGMCHNDPHHPTVEEWQLSGHAAALSGLLANSFSSNECLECHSQDYRYAMARVARGEIVEVPTLETAQFAIECSTCHASHGGTGEAGQLHLPIANLCGQCHTVEEAMLGETPHHPQIEMLVGEGAFDADAQPFVQAGEHSSLAAEGGQACARCHVVRHEVEDPNEGNPNVTGHTFNPFDESITEHQADQYTGCGMCHDAEGAADRRMRVQERIASRLSALAAYFDSANPSYIDPLTLSDTDQSRLSTARFNYQFVNADGSVGVHNPSYADDALDIAESIVVDLAP